MNDNPAEGRFIDRYRSLILAGTFALFLLVLLPAVQRLGASGMVNPTFLLLVLAPWLLGFVVLVVDRPGPLKFWLAPLLLSTIAPALALCHDWVVVSHWQRTHSLPNGLLTMALNSLLIGSFTLYLAHMFPRRCPHCGRVALVPLLRLSGRSKRLPTTRWCSGCGGLYWRLRKGHWQKERRATWLDEAAAPSPPVEGPGVPNPPQPAPGTMT